ncbi:mevalonate kinase family protein [Salinispira pacifica]
MTSYDVRTPGRICLLGDNTDLIEKPTLAAAISAYLSIEIEPNTTDRIVFTAADLGVTEEFRIGEVPPLDTPLRYSKAVCRRFSSSITSGFNATIRSEIPIGAGLSSSTALCIGTIRALDRVFGLGLSRQEVAEAAYIVESEDLGVECGRLDQYSITFGGVSYIDTGPKPSVQSLHTGKLPIVVADTQEQHNTQELQIWLRKRIREKEPLLTESLDRVVGLVEEGKRAIEANDLQALGELMNRQQVEEKLMGTSTERLELLCKAARSAGAIGAKQMGAGGGGCIIALCTPEATQPVVDALKAQGAPVWQFDVVSSEETGEDR